jgi:cytochrome P450
MISWFGGPVRLVVDWMYRPAGELFRIRDNTARAIEAAKSRDQKTCTQKTTAKLPCPVVSGILTSNLPHSDLNTTRLTDELLTLLLAGTVTTAQMLTLALYFILSSPPISSRLRAELAPLYSSSPTAPSWATLSQLPYLTATITESLRLA